MLCITTLEGSLQTDPHSYSVGIHHHIYRWSTVDSRHVGYLLVSISAEQSEQPDHNSFLDGHHRSYIIIIWSITGGGDKLQTELE